MHTQIKVHPNWLFAWASKEAADQIGRWAGRQADGAGRKAKECSQGGFYIASFDLAEGRLQKEN